MNEHLHPVFGPLRPDPEFRDWIGSLEVGDTVVELRLIVDGEPEIPADFEVLYLALVPKLRLLLSDAAKWVLSDLAHWLSNDEDRSLKAIERQMHISTVQIYAGDGATVWFHGPAAIHDSGHAIEGRIGEHASLSYFCLSG